MTKPIQFSINELMAATVVGAIAAWMVSQRLSLFIPAMLAMVVGIAYRNKSDFPLPLLMFGGAGIGIALTISTVLSYSILFQSGAMFPKRFWYLPLSGIAMAWGITWIIYLQFRKMIIRPVTKEQGPQVQIGNVSNQPQNESNI